MPAVFGCVALIVGQLCFAGERITCSDSKIASVDTCKEYIAKAGVAITSGTSTSVIVMPPR